MYVFKFDINISYNRHATLETQLTHPVKGLKYISAARCVGLRQVCSSQQVMVTVRAVKESIEKDIPLKKSPL